MPCRGQGAVAGSVYAATGKKGVAVSGSMFPPMPFWTTLATLGGANAAISKKVMDVCPCVYLSMRICLMPGTTGAATMATNVLIKPASLCPGKRSSGRRRPKATWLSSRLRAQSARDTPNGDRLGDVPGDRLGDVLPTCPGS